MLYLVCLEAVETTMQQPNLDFLDITDTIVGIIVNTLVILGGVLGFSYIKKLREKQQDNIFGYLTKLNVRIDCIYQIVINNKDVIVEQLINTSNRRIPGANTVQSTHIIMENLSQNASETLKFLMSEENQFPAKKGWTKCLNMFISFLIDCEQLKNPSFFKWMNREDSQEDIDKYMNNITKCMETLLTMISDCQIKLENKICKHEKTEKNKKDA